MKRLSREEIADVLKRGTRAHGLLCTYAWRPRTTGAISVVVSKKVAPTAVGRNRVKRRIRAAAGAVEGVQRAVVVIAKQAAVDAPVSSLRDEFARLMARAV